MTIPVIQKSLAEAAGSAALAHDKMDGLFRDLFGEPAAVSTADGSLYKGGSLGEAERTAATLATSLDLLLWRVEDLRERLLGEIGALGVPSDLGQTAMSSGANLRR